MNKIAKEMNEVLEKNSQTFHDFLSEFGKNIYMPKGIIVQSNEAKEHANKFNATIGIATEKNEPMHFTSIMKYFNYLNPDEIFNYAPPAGIAKLRNMWQEKILKENSIEKSAISLPVVTHALTHGLSIIGDLFVDRGTEIITSDKYWENYHLIFEIRNNAKINTYNTFNAELTGLDLDSLDKVLKNSKSHKVLIIFNFPNNPSGYTPTEKEAEEIKKIILRHAESGKKILALVDDAYYGLGYENDLVKGSIFSKFVRLHKNVASVKVDGFTKEYYVWGFRIGFLTFSDFNCEKNTFEILEKKTAASIRSTISNCSMPVQSMFIKFLNGNEYLSDKKEKFEILKARALKTKEIVHDKKYSDCWSVYPFNSGYFMCLKIKGINANVLREHILKNYGVGTIALGDTDLRVAFSSVELENLTELFEIIAKGIKELKK